MATVVRVKRRCEDEPIEAFIINCKRRKVSNDNIDPVATTVFKFAGTLEKDEDIVSHLDKAKYAEAQKAKKNNLKEHLVDCIDKLRSEHKETAKRNRYKIVSSFRSETTKNITEANEAPDKSVTVLDLENDLEENGDEKLQSGEKNYQKYVYDLYYNHSGDLRSGEIEDYVSALPVYDYHSVSSLADNNESLSDNESEDSNAEDNWRNDYPDESDVESINENDMMHAMKNLELDDILSGDDEEDDFLYDNEDVRRYGKLYARLKAEYNEEIISDSEDDLSE